MSPDKKISAVKRGGQRSVTRLAVVQQPPLFLDKSAAVKRTVALIKEAAGNGANLLVFPEAFISGYPVWIWRLRPGTDFDLNEEIHAGFFENTVNLDGDDLEPLYKAAGKYKVTVVCGIEEREGHFGRGTVYNTVVVVGPDGRLLNKHRKLMPTNPERMVWGLGDASGLRVVDTPQGRIGALICWENYMPLARYALYAEGVEILVAPTYDSGEGWLGTMQHIGREGCCWVVGCGNAIRGSDFPEDFPGISALYPDPDEWLNVGDSVVVGPDGEIVAGPLREEQGIIYTDIDRKQVGLRHRTLDVVGHYSRPDIFHLHINRAPQKPVEFDEK